MPRKRKKTPGGVRAGSGRKTIYSEDTKVVAYRVPISAEAGFRDVARKYLSSFLKPKEGN